MRLRVLSIVALALCCSATSFSQTVDPSLFAALKWRLIGPFRAGRVSAGAIDPVNPHTFYLGTPNGGVWKTTNSGETWRPIFDATGVASIGAVAVAPSNTNVIYVGTGEETRGNGVYRSTDGGATWTSVGLTETHFIGAIVVDPANPDVALVAAIGDRVPGPERGVFRTIDGGRSWTKVLFRDPSSGCATIVAAPDDPRVLYATLYPAVASRGVAPAPPVGTTPAAGAPFAPPPAVYKSLDGGITWNPLKAAGLPGPPTGRQAFGVVAGTRGQTVFAGVREGFFRSSDGGETWERWTTDPRIRPFGVITDPSNPAIVYVTQTSMYRSTDGGRTFDAFAGAPSGDDFQLLWIDPHNSRRLFAGVDQGGIVSVDGGETWSSWYNQPTGQFYHVSTDARFPYHVFAAQQDSGSVALPNRSDYGQISFRDWYSPGGFEFGYIVPDPLDENIVFAGGWYRTVVRFDRRTGQIAHVFVPGMKYRSVNNAPMAFSPQDGRTLYLGTQYLMKTTDAGQTWQEASPDLTDVPGKAQPVVIGPRGAQGASILTVSPSRVKAGVIWVGTSNAVVQRTDDGGATWHHVSPAELPAGGGFEIIDAGRHDAATAYAALIVPNDLHPYIYRTHDGGATWQKIVNGLPDTAFVRVVREDPVRKGLLFCGTETGVYVSFDDGDRWQSLQLNLPSSSVRDMVVSENKWDLVLVTYGRGVWILDNITPLRQISPQFTERELRLFEPATGVRVRWDVYGDTPLPIETPTAPNPPDGAIVDYYLKTAPAGALTLTIKDESGAVVRAFSSVPPPEPKLLANVPSYWFAPPPVLSTRPGLNRFAWNLRYATPKVLPFAYAGGILTFVEYTLADHAVPGQTPREQPEGALVLPGKYTLELSGGGHTDTQVLTVLPDPRVQASAADLAAQHRLAATITGALAATYDGYGALGAVRDALADRMKKVGAQSGAENLAATLRTLDEQVAAVQYGTPAAPGLGLVNRDMARFFNMLESGDAKPAGSVVAAVTAACESLTKSIAAWRALAEKSIPAASAQLARKRLSALPAARPAAVVSGCVAYNP